MQDIQSDQMTVEQAARVLDGESCLAADHSVEQRWWSFKVLGLTIYCYNFEWRRKALYYHDLHHVVTGYPCTIRGECQVAAWEFSAGRFPNFFASLFCLPLISLGMLISPARTLRAFLAGQHAASLYDKELGADVGTWPLEKLRALTAVDRAPAALQVQMLKFCGWLAASLALTLGVPALVFLALMQPF